MDLLPLITSLSRTDVAAVTLLLGSWALLGFWVEHSGSRWPSTQRLMARYRREWMINHIRRDPRVSDAMLLGSLREGTAFLASACLIALGGGLALIGNTERLENLAQELMLDPSPTAIWELKIILPLILITNGFLKFVWSHRVFGYCSVMMGAVPNDPSSEEAALRAETAAELNIEAAKAFNRGLRSVYFALAALGWLLGPTALCVTALVCIITVWQREFNSRSRAVLLLARQKKLAARAARSES